MRVVVMLKTKEIITSKTVGALLKTLTLPPVGKKTWEESIVVSLEQVLNLIKEEEDLKTRKEL